LAFSAFHAHYIMDLKLAWQQAWGLLLPMGLMALLLDLA
jgi:predicted solute-binding protein